MKTLYLLLIALFLITLSGCTKEETLIPTSEKCALASTETLPANVLVHVTPADTVWFDYDQPIGMWIDGQIDWT